VIATVLEVGNCHCLTATRPQLDHC
jgi:hypothetical protein